MFVTVWILQYVTFEAVIPEGFIAECFPGFSSNLRGGCLSEPRVSGCKNWLCSFYFLAPHH